MLADELERLGALIDWERRSRGGGAAGTQGSGMRVTVDPAVDLLARLGSPEAGLRVVHVAGTKGKGSVAALVAAGLGAAGLRPGVFASPHVERVHERIRIAGEEIADAELEEVLRRALDAQAAAREEGTPAAGASWFDVVTAAAVLAFRRAEVGWAVVECGLGGRLDSTNALSGEVCVITNIDLEHTEVLGSTLAEIAREKAGILDPGAVLVTGVPAEGEAGAAIDARARELDVSVVRLERAARTIEEENAELARLVLVELGRRGVRGRGGPLDGTELDAAARSAARLPGRLELRRAGRVRVVLDGAHVPSSLARVLADLDRSEVLSGSPVVAVLGVGRDKDLPGLLKVLHGRVDRVVCTSVGTGPVRSPGEILEVATGLRLAAETAVGPRVALSRALELADPEGVVLVTGSLHLVGALRPHLPPNDRC